MLLGTETTDETDGVYLCRTYRNVMRCCWVVWCVFVCTGLTAMSWDAVRQQCRPADRT